MSNKVFIAKVRSFFEQTSYLRGQGPLSAAYENICRRIWSALLILLFALVLCRLDGDCAEFKINIKSFMT